MTIEETLVKFVTPEPNTGCWLWTGAEKGNGYGNLTYKYKSYLAHRFIYASLKGKIPKGQHLCHKCDTRACVNPDHLFLGTPKDNMRDMIKKGRNLKGEQVHNTKLTSSDVLNIRQKYSNGVFQTILAKQYGIGQSTISRIILRKVWRHI